MPLYPYCVLTDVSAKNLQRTAYSSSTNPTSTQVNQYMLSIYGQIQGTLAAAGYGTIYETSSTIAGAITAGSGVSVDFASATGFSKGDLVKIEGLSSGARAWEFAEITAISSNTVTLNTVSNSYDASSVSVYLVNSAMLTLREINALGAAWKAEEAAFMKTAPNRSEHAEVLRELFFGNADNMSGLWAILNIPGFLVGASTTDDAPVVRSQITSYNSENSTDSDVEPRFEIDEDF